MAGRRVRPKPPALDDVSGDTWMWGNTRGGGGAPLRDTSGNTVTNLKLALSGVTDVDHSPTNVRAKKSMGFEDDDPEPPRRRYNREEYDRNFEHTERNMNNHQNYSPQNSPKKAPNVVVDFEKDSRRKKELEYQAQLREQIEEKQRKKDSEKRKDAETKQKELKEYLATQYKGPVPDYVKEMVSQPPKIRGKGGNANNDNYDGRYDRDREYRTDRGGGALRGNDDREEWPQQGGMYNGRPPRGDAAKVGQRGGYGNRGNDDDYNGEDAPDDRRTYYRGNNIRRGAGTDVANRRHRSISPSPPPVEIEASRRGDGGDFDDEYDGRRGNSHARGGGGMEAARRRSTAAVDSDDDIDRNREYNSPSRRRNQGGGGGRRHAAVDSQEYDELSNLCDKLLTQQEDLQREIKQQAKVIKELQQKSAGVVGVGAGAGLNRSRSVQAPRRASRVDDDADDVRNYHNSNNMARGGAGGGAPRTAGAGRSSTAQRERPQLKVAFGSVAAAVPSAAEKAAQAPKKILNPNAPFAPKAKKGNAGGGNSKMSAAGSNIAGVRGVGGGKNAKQPPTMGAQRYGEKGSPHAKAGARELRKVDGVSKALRMDDNMSAASAGNAFARLNLAAQKGPIVVTYEDEENRGGGRGGRNGAAAHSPHRRSGNELQGRSEYIQGNDDNISGDQLDKLLLQARRARVYDS